MDSTTGRTFPTAEVSQDGSNVTLTVGSKGTTLASASADFSVAPYQFVVEDANGGPPAFNSFGSLLYVNGGLLTLAHGERFRISVVVPASKTPAPRSFGEPLSPSEKPPSPPRNGVNNAVVKIPRQELVKKILSNRIVVIRSPPATGKTSLLDLTEAALERSERPNVKVVRLDIVAGMPEKTTTQGLLAHLGDELRVGCLPNGFRKLPEDQDTWILIDDAQLAFGAEGFWQVVIKYLENLPQRSLHVVVAATYDLKSHGTTPVVFEDYPHLQDLRLSAGEAVALYDGYIAKLPFATGWDAFKDKLLKLSNGHVGVLTGGIGLLHQECSNAQKRITMEEALEALQGNHFKVRLHRCFPHHTLMKEEQRAYVANTICKGPLTTKKTRIDTSDSENPLAQLVRAGILTIDGTFSCLLAQHQYFNYFYQRPNQAPDNLANLIRKSVSSMSALRLLQSSLGREFPKEAAFQQLFNEAMTMQLPPHVAVCPELNTFATNLSGEVQTGELDFLIDGGEFQWAVELLVNGDKINEHVARFDASNGKYRKVGHSEYIIIDCKRARTRSVETMANRCTLYFADDFKQVECKMGFADYENLSLQT